MTVLTQKRCKPCEGGTSPLTATEAKELLQQTPGWICNDNASEIHRTFEFKNYYQTMAFVNALAWVAHREDHHPDVEVGYRRCRVRYSTHAIGGLSENDFICAAKINAL
ncbi:MAG: 4a-hydroxytetrahydrobiopterin dehydratase, partial [Acidiferrobacterales bacterium]